MLDFMARPERFELPTTWFVARYSIQLSYGRVLERPTLLTDCSVSCYPSRPWVPELEHFSRPAGAAQRPPLPLHPPQSPCAFTAEGAAL